MTPSLIVLRPEPGATATVQRARSAGLAAISSPLLTIEPLPWQPPDPAGFDALLLGSANAVRYGGAGLRAFRDLPVYAVGAATAAVARDAGFDVVAVGEGNLQAMLDRVANDGRRRALRIAGVERVALGPPPELAIEAVTVYAARTLRLTPEALAALRHGAVALLHSAAVARAFVEACEDNSLNRHRIALACLSSRIAAAAGNGWVTVEVSTAPDDPALLALAGEMCQSRRFGATDHNH